MFHGLRKKKIVEVHAVVSGKIRPLQEVHDEMFSKGLVGRGIAILPEENVIVSPVNGTLNVVFPTGHAFGITDENGFEFLLHIGIDTISLKGEGFQLLVQQGEQVKVGDPLVKVDFSLLKEKGLSIDTLIIISSDEKVCDVNEMLAKDTVVKGSKSVLFQCVKR